MKTIKQYKYGDCIPESIKIYCKLEKKGYNPYMVEGYAITNSENEIWLNKFQHTWVEVKGHKIDITKNQFNKYGEIKKYKIKEKYKLNKNEKGVYYE